MNCKIWVNQWVSFTTHFSWCGKTCTNVSLTAASSRLPVWTWTSSTALSLLSPSTLTSTQHCFPFYSGIPLRMPGIIFIVLLVFVFMGYLWLFFTEQTPFYICLYSRVYSAYINSDSQLELLNNSFPRIRLLWFMAASLCLEELLALMLQTSALLLPLRVVVWFCFTLSLIGWFVQWTHQDSFRLQKVDFPTQHSLSKMKGKFFGLCNWFVQD